ncbi:MAG: sigma-54-dependent Fis family transcriptional regulator [Planctomycetes bacterium]|nr:sigma-54-dependent Fis family transcriptional regulator [Planctomycetota bacterium]
MPRCCNILLVDDHEATRETIAEVLEDAGHEVMTAEKTARAISLLETNSYDLVLTDLMLPDGSGMSVLEKSKNLYPNTPVVMITGHGSIENAIEATRLGAYEYLTKPVDLNKLRVIVKNALHLVQLERKIEQAGSLDAIVGQSNAIVRVKDLIKQVAHTDATIMIQGESGTGKELVANAVQALSARKDRSYVKVNVAVLAKELVESELFGHEKGAFSGAIRQRKGRFELADNGTIFLDEIGEMPLESQVKLLRVLQEREFERVGGTETMPIDIRLIVATNLDLKKEVGLGNFREDLYFRINVVKIQVPPLRERMEDVPLLAEHFLRKFCARYSMEKQLSAEALNSLLSYGWPGNIRELENAIESAVVKCPGDIITCAELPDEVTGGYSGSEPVVGSGYPAGLPLEEIEKHYILAELNRHDGNKTQAAKSLGIGLKTLYRKLESYDVS